MTSQVQQSSLEGNWYCVRTQLKREKLAAKNLRELEQVDVFLPRIRYQKATRRGRVWWVEPLFPGYLLVKFNLAEQERAVAYAGGVSKILKFGDETPIISEKFVEELRAEWDQFEAEDEELLVERVVNLGEQVEVATGAFQGVSGQVIELKPGNQRVALLLEFLGEERPVEFDVLDLLLERTWRPLGGTKDSAED